jgi:hypothetical protein
VTPVPFNLLGLDNGSAGWNTSPISTASTAITALLHAAGDRPARIPLHGEVGNYLLSHKEVVDHIRKRGKTGKVMFIMFDEESERLVSELGLEMALPPASCACISIPRSSPRASATKRASPARPTAWAAPTRSKSS